MKFIKGLFEDAAGDLAAGLQDDAQLIKERIIYRSSQSPARPGQGPRDLMELDELDADLFAMPVAEQEEASLKAKSTFFDRRGFAGALWDRGEKKKSRLSAGGVADPKKARNLVNIGAISGIDHPKDQGDLMAIGDLGGVGDISGIGDVGAVGGVGDVGDVENVGESLSFNIDDMG